MWKFFVVFVKVDRPSFCVLWCAMVNSLCVCLACFDVDNQRVLSVAGGWESMKNKDLNVCVCIEVSRPPCVPILSECLNWVNISMKISSGRMCEWWWCGNNVVNEVESWREREGREVEVVLLVCHSSQRCVLFHCMSCNLSLPERLWIMKTLKVFTRGPGNDKEEEGKGRKREKQRGGGGGAASERRLGNTESMLVPCCCRCCQFLGRRSHSFWKVPCEFAPCSISLPLSLSLFLLSFSLILPFDQLFSLPLSLVWNSRDLSESEGWINCRAGSGHVAYVGGLVSLHMLAFHTFPLLRLCLSGVFLFFSRPAFRS